MQAYSGRPGLPRAGVRKLPAVWSERGEDTDFDRERGKCMQKEKKDGIFIHNCWRYL